MAELYNSLAPLAPFVAIVLTVLLGLYTAALLAKAQGKSEGHSEGLASGYEAGFRAGYEYARPGLKWGGSPPSNPFKSHK